MVAGYSGNAYHIAGGDFTYKWVGGNNFEVRLTLYRDCSNPQASDFDDSIKVSVFDRVTNLRTDSCVMHVTQTDSLTLSGTGCSVPTGVCMQYGNYVKVMTLADNPHGYYIVWERCCRNSTVTNISLPDQAGMTFYAEIGDPALHNSSPQFNSHPLPFICVNQFFRYGFAATDAEGDSLVFTLVDPLDGGHTSQFNPNPYSYTPFNNTPIYPEPGPYLPINWSPGYNLTNICGSSAPLVMNTATGEMEVLPDLQGIFAVAVEIREYRNGIYIGLIRREIEFTVIYCTDNTAPQLPPQYTGVANIEVYATDTININLTVTDENGDSIFVKRTGDIFGNSVPLIIDPPYAVSPDTIGIDTLRTYFTWNTGCQHVSVTEYKVSYDATDNGCPLFLTDVGKLNILVKEPPFIAKSNLLCIDLINDSILSITRASDTAYTERYFEKFILYRSLNGSAFQPYKTIYDINPLLILDSAAYNNRDNDYCYVLSAINNCNHEGLWSDTLCSVSHINTHKNYIESVSVTAENEITVKWEEFNDGPYARYEIYRVSSDSILIPVQSLSSYPEFEWKDHHVNTSSESYCYAMINEDVCGNESDTSLIACSILLAGNADYYVNHLEWTDYINYRGGIGSYKVMRKGLTSATVFRDIAEVTGSELIYFDRDMNKDDGIFRYVIKAVEGAGGNNATSLSNEIELHQQPIVFTPTAFTPNNDGRNDYFRAESNFVTEFEISIYNRWGQPVFHSDDIASQWDGSDNDRSAPTGIYFYKIKYKGYDDKTFTELNGSITLIR